MLSGTTLRNECHNTGHRNGFNCNAIAPDSVNPVTVVSVCLLSDALSQCLLSYWGFSDLGRGVISSAAHHSSTVQPLLLCSKMESGITRTCIGGNNFVSSVKIWRGRPMRRINGQAYHVTCKGVNITFCK